MTCNLALIGLRIVVFENMFENNGHVHVYSIGTGADNRLGPDFLYKDK